MATAKRFPLRFLVPVAIVALFWGFWMLIAMLCLFIKSPRKFMSSKTIVSKPACAEDRSLGEHGFVALGGEANIRLHYVAAGHEGQPLMLLLHGFPECWHSWKFQLKEFSKDYRVVAVDMRGYGESDKPSGILNYTLERFCDDVPAIVSALGYKKCILVGLDLGGIIVYSVGSRFPEICEKIVILNAPHGAAMQKHMMSSLKQFMASWYVFFFQVPWLPEMFVGYNDLSFIRSCYLGKKLGLRNKQNVSEDDVNLLKYYLQSFESRTAIINFYRANMRYTSKNSKVKIQAPLLLIWGTADAALTKEVAAKSLAFTEKGELKTIEGASHWVQQDEPQLVNQYMREFLEK